MQRPLVSVALCTLERPALLAACLESLRSQRTKVRLECVVVENAAKGPSAAIVRRFARKAAFPMRCLREPVRNISLARNRSLAACRGEWIAMIDDDEVAQPDWLEEFLRASRRHRSSAFAGKTVRRLPPGFPTWQRPFFAAAWPTDLAVLAGSDFCGAGNFFFPARFARSLKGPFDPAFGRTGSEDLDFFTRLLGLGVSIRFAGRAVVTETQELRRASIKWHLARAYRINNGRMRVRYRDAPKGKVALTIIASSLAGAGKAVLNGCRHGDPRVAGLAFAKGLAGQAGKLGHLLGRRVHEYGG